MYVPNTRSTAFLLKMAKLYKVLNLEKSNRLQPSHNHNPTCKLHVNWSLISKRKEYLHLQVNLTYLLRLKQDKKNLLGQRGNLLWLLANLEPSWFKIIKTIRLPESRKTLPINREGCFKSSSTSSKRLLGKYLRKQRGLERRHTWR